MAVSIILFIVIFFLVVISHEFGHFIIAKRNGIHVVEFFIGMGPKLFSFKKGDTEYSLRLFPIGGACMFEGEDELETREGEASEGAFPNAPVWVRFATILAGPMFNFILAYVAAFILVSVSGVYTTELSYVSEGSGAAQAGLMAGDVITKINGKSVHISDDITLISLVNIEGKSYEISYVRDGQTNTVEVTPVYDEDEQRYFMGIQAGVYQKCSVGQNFKYAFHTMSYGVKSTVYSLKMIVKGQVSKDDVSGPVGMVMMVDQVYDVAKEYGALSVALNMIWITMLLSVNLGIMNLLPIPALDGGRLVFLLIEAVRGKPIPPEKEGMVHLAGMMALILLMVVVFFNDISKFFR